MSHTAAKISIVLLASLALALLGAGGASADKDFSKYAIESASASLSSGQAGAHDDFTATFTLNSTETTPPKPYAFTRDVIVRLAPGLFGNPQAIPPCTLSEFSGGLTSCAQDTQVGVAQVKLAGAINTTLTEPIYNMQAPGGDIAARFGFYAANYPTLINVRLDPADNTLVAAAEGASAAAEPIAVTTTFWGVPAAPVHDALRLNPKEGLEGKLPAGGRKSGQAEVPFMTNPTDCLTPKQITFTAISYQVPEAPSTMSAPFPQIGGCGLVEFNPDASAAPTTTQGSSPSGLGFDLSLPTKGLESPNVYAGSQLKRAEVTLPEGMTVNPSQAVGLGVCTEADLARETYDSPPNAGCPESSKVGSVLARTPVLDRNAEGSLYIAKPYENPFDSLLALYMVLKVPDRGIAVKLAGRVSLDPQTGQITTVFDDIPQLPVSSFELHFREGARSPLITPPTCGPHVVTSNFTPWSAPGKVTTRTSTFKVESGPDHGPCPAGGLPPFHPNLVAGTLNNAAGSFSPFNARLTRTDTEQEFTNFSLKLPPGVAGKLAGIPYCTDAQIARATSRSGPHGGAEESADPSCPAASQVGSTLAGAGVGQVLAYAPGKIYLAGPYHGAPISLVAITSGVVGPFDIGTVVVRLAVKVNPESGEVFLDATGSDPIPHIVRGVVLHLRDIRAYTDKPNFTYNPTNCTPTSTAATALGSGLDFVSPTDDNPFVSTSPFQAADCAALPFAPKLTLSLSGGTKRGDYPKLKAFLRMRGFGEAGIARAQVTLPRSEFIANAHFNTICTRVQFKAQGGNGEACPAGSIYGWARAKTPVLADPLEGPVFLRSSEHELPDVVASLRGQQINVHLVGHVDSVKGQLRNTFETVPDAPVEWASFSFKGGKKGLFENSTNLCAKANRADVRFTGQNGKTHNYRPAVKVKCGGKKAKQKRTAR